MNTLNSKKLKNAFGTDDFGISEIPTKISNVKIARIFHGERMGCSYCFPHGWETVNSTGSKNFKSWKNKKKKQWSQKKKSYKAIKALKDGKRWLNDGIERETWISKKFSIREIRKNIYNYPPNGYKWPYEK